MTDNSLRDHSLSDKLSDHMYTQQWAHGDRGAYEALVERHAPMVFARCARQLGDSDADDACQAVFLILLRSAVSAGKHPVFVAWLLRVCDNVILNAKRDRVRRQRRERQQQVSPIMSVDFIREEADVMPPELLDSIDEYVSALPKREREVIELHFFAGHSLAEIARQTDTAKTTIASRLQRGVERMRSAYRKRGIHIAGTLLLSCLSQVASASMSTSLSDRLKNMAPTRDAGSTTAIPASAQAMRWSQGNIIMSHPYISAAVGAAGLFCVIGLSSMLWSADAKIGKIPTDISKTEVNEWYDTNTIATRTNIEIMKGPPVVIGYHENDVGYDSNSNKNTYILGGMTAIRSYTFKWSEKIDLEDDHKKGATMTLGFDLLPNNVRRHAHVKLDIGNSVHFIVISEDTETIVAEKMKYFSVVVVDVEDVLWRKTVAEKQDFLMEINILGRNESARIIGNIFAQQKAESPNHRMVITQKEFAQLRGQMTRSFVDSMSGLVDVLAQDQKINGNG